MRYDLTVFETSEEEVYEIGPTLVKYDLTNPERRSILFDIDELKKINAALFFI